MEDDKNGRRQNGRRPKRKKTNIEVDQNGRKPRWKRTKMEDDQNGNKEELSYDIFKR